MSSSASSYAVKNLDLNGSTPRTVQPLNNDEDFCSNTTPSYTIDDVAKELRPRLRWDGSRSPRNKLLFTFAFLLGNGPWAGLFFGGICDSVPLGLVFTALMLPWIAAVLVTKNVSPEALQFYVEHPDAAKKTGKRWSSLSPFSLILCFHCQFFFLFLLSL